MYWKNNVRRSVLSLLIFLALSIPAWAQNECWTGGADYSTTASGGHEDSKVIWGTSGALGSGGGTDFCEMTVTNNSLSTVWAMIFDSLTLPANATKPKMEFPVPTNATVGEHGYPFMMFTGIVVACSSTEGTLTVTTNSACNFHVKIAR